LEIFKIIVYAYALRVYMVIYLLLLTCLLSNTMQSGSLFEHVLTQTA